MTRTVPRRIFAGIYLNSTDWVTVSDGNKEKFIYLSLNDNVAYDYLHILFISQYVKHKQHMICLWEPNKVEKIQWCSGNPVGNLSSINNISMIS